MNGYLCKFSGEAEPKRHKEVFPERAAARHCQQADEQSNVIPWGERTVLVLVLENDEKEEWQRFRVTIERPTIYRGQPENC